MTFPKLPLLVAEEPDMARTPAARVSEGPSGFGAKAAAQQHPAPQQRPPSTSSHPTRSRERSDSPAKETGQQVCA
jgi:hypothetical protein